MEVFRVFRRVVRCTSLEREVPRIVTAREGVKKFASAWLHKQWQNKNVVGGGSIGTNNNGKTLG